MLAVPVLTVALLVGVPAAALAGAATDDASRAAASAATDAATGAPPAATAGSGSTVAPFQATREMRARALIAAEGYDSITGLEPTRDGYQALAVKDGKVMAVAVDNDGRVRRLR
jgi:hypothetical protein